MKNFSSTSPTISKGRNWRNHIICYTTIIFLIALFSIIALLMFVEIYELKSYKIIAISNNAQTEVAEKIPEIENNINDSQDAKYIEFIKTKNRQFNIELTQAKGVLQNVKNKDWAIFTPRGGDYQFAFPITWTILEEQTNVAGVTFLTPDYSLKIVKDARPKFAVLKKGAKFWISKKIVEDKNWMQNSIDHPYAKAEKITTGGKTGVHFNKGEDVQIIAFEFTEKGYPDVDWIVEINFYTTFDEIEYYENILLTMAESLKFD